jgi:hypothetical protein
MRRVLDGAAPAARIAIEYSGPVTVVSCGARAPGDRARVNASSVFARLSAVSRSVPVSAVCERRVSKGICRKVRVVFPRVSCVVGVGCGISRGGSAGDGSGGWAAASTGGLPCLVSASVLGLLVSVAG